jgi:hypothetical protein
MTLTIEVPAELENALEGVSLSALALAAFEREAQRRARNAGIRALALAPAHARETAMRQSAIASAPFYADSLTNGGELTELTVALQGEAVRDD